MNEQKLIAKLRLIERLASGAATKGEEADRVISQVLDQESSEADVVEKARMISS